MATDQRQPAIESSEGFTIVGIPFEATEESDFAAFWDEFGERIDEFPDAPQEHEAYGVSYAYVEASGEFTYLPGVRVEDDVAVPEGWTAVEIPAGEYAVFTTSLAEVGETMAEIYRDWLPASDYQRRDAPEYEHYAGAFDAQDPASTFTIHIPVV